MTAKISPDREYGKRGLYIHVPFCRSKCPYCSFNSVACVDPSEHRKYLVALECEARLLAAHEWTAHQTFASLFIGGGTPTILSGRNLSGLVQTCLDIFPFASSKGVGPEVSVEMNPNTVDGDTLAAIRDAGVNRLSIGMQAMDDTLLINIGRSHTVAEARDSMRLARTIGFDNISIDLMYGLPGQQLQQWERTLEQALEIGPDHISAYALTVEKKTPFDLREQRGELLLPAEDEVAAMADITEQTLGQAGYARYEISNYARPGFGCIHNINYWQNGSYIGLGAGAVSCFSGMRTRNFDNPSTYIRMIMAGRFPYVEAECLDRDSRFRESVIMGLRMIDGVSIKDLEKRFGLTPQQYYGELLNRFVQQGMVAIEAGKMRLTRKALPVANQILAELV